MGVDQSAAVSNLVILATPAPITHRTPEETLGLGYLASILRGRGYEVRIVDGWLEKLTSDEIVDAIVRMPTPLWLGFSSYRSNMSRVFEVVQRLKERGLMFPVVAGGFGPTFHVDDFLSIGVDVVARGEAEETVIELTEHYATGKPPLSEIRGISYRMDGATTHTGARQMEKDLDALPMPARDTLPSAMRRHAPVHLSTSRGCTRFCPFCSIIPFVHMSKGPGWRGRSVSNIVDEIEATVALGARHFKVIDDSFLEPPRDADWCRTFADEVTRRGLKFSARGMIRADTMDEDVARELKRVGFTSFFVGIESYAPAVLKRMAKTAKVEDNYRCLAALHKYGMYVMEGHIHFDDRTTLEELRQDYQGMRDHPWVLSRGVFSEMYAAEGTPYTRLLDKKGLLERDNSGLGNHRYEIKNAQVRSMYDALKRWHRARMSVYDKVLEPPGGPKAVEPPDMALFHSLYMEIRAQDLDLFAEVLDRAEHSEPADEILAFVDRRIDETSE